MDIRTTFGSASGSIMKMGAFWRHLGRSFEVGSRNAEVGSGNSEVGMRPSTSSGGPKVEKLKIRRRSEVETDRAKHNLKVSGVRTKVGCAHQISLIASVKGGHSPPYTNNAGANHR